MGAAPELKATLNLPKTDFPMKANLPLNEPKWLADWQRIAIYDRIREARSGAPVYVLHDGPPYANGPIHLGHALNKCLKDFIVKSKTMAGFDAPYVPGWDCHGLPIEIKVDDALGRKKLQMEPLQVRQECRKYAARYLDLQRSQFLRLGIFGRFHRPYLTMSPDYEAVIEANFFHFLEHGFVYKGLRPVYWCIHDRTALAEAEVEYEMHTSPSVWVRYDLTSDPAAIDPALAGRRVSTIIWTTTPWTLPASMAIAFHPDLEYVALEREGRAYIVAGALAEATQKACGLEDAAEVARFPGKKLEFSTFQHPFLDRRILGVNADYVTTDQGTGAVHTAPSHGLDDFYTGAKYGLDRTCDVDAAGRIAGGLPEYSGKRVFEANPRIIALLRERGRLMAEERIQHSYPHCWRCHNPVIYRATEQWFISMEAQLEGGTLRRRAREEIDRVVWDPAWGKERISNMIATRPDWCISRQRVWGVPLAVFLCAGCRQPLLSGEINSRIVELFSREGADAWYSRSAEEILPAGTACSHCSGTKFEKEMDIIDVWFESGSSQTAVLGHEPNLPWPADLYLEGSDQYRGWFHSSLLCALAVRNQSPYRKVATSGWTLDPQGRAMSKSLGNVVDPVDIANRLGGEIVRLWVASVDFRDDVRASEELMQRIAENYRKVRNTFRYILQNLFDFVPDVNKVPFAEMAALDRYMLHRTDTLIERVRDWYDEFAFHRIYHQLHDFCAVDLSAVYFDVLKDRLYTSAPDSKMRRSAQTAIWKIGEALVRLLAPIMSFTADEVWKHFPQIFGRETSVHLALFPAAGSLAEGLPRSTESDWDSLMGLRGEVLKALEIARRDKVIGSPLDAKVKISASNGAWELLQRNFQELRPLWIVSQVELERAAHASGDSGLRIQVSPADGNKCERCWNYSVEVGRDSRYPTICERCSAALDEMAVGRHNEAK